MTYTPLPGSVPARVVAHLQTLPEGTELATAELAEAIGQSTATVTPCMEHARKMGAVVVRKDLTKGPKGTLFWRLGTAVDQLRAASELEAEKAAKQAEHQAEKADDVRPPAAPTPGPAVLGWKPARPFYEPPPEPEETAPAVKPDLTPEPAPAEREHHLGLRAWFSSDGQLVVETPELELVFGRLEARQLVRTIREIGEAWA